MTSGHMTVKKVDGELKFERSCCPITNALDVVGDK